MASASEQFQQHRAELIAALLRPECYPHAVDRIEHLQTHISDVFLTGRYAYKLKKPLELGFLDFSTLEKRRHFSEEELRLNRRLAPDLYLAVLPITGTPRRPRVGGDGAVLDYAVQMRQFDQSGMLERLVARRELTDRHIDELAQVVADFHAQLSPVSLDSEYGTAEAIVSPALQNFSQLTPLLEEQNELGQLEQLRVWTQLQNDALAPIFEQRRRNGWVRECHGDLHLGNIVVIDGQVRVFDCIEFNPALRWIDVMSELAFVAMDLLARNQAPFAYRFLDRYLQLTGDYSGVALLRYYIVYRALVRAKVAMMRVRQAEIDENTSRSLTSRVHAHIELAARMSRQTRPALIVMHGLSGSGKTSSSQLLLQAIGAIRVRSDVERKRLHRLTAEMRSHSELDSGLYSAGATESTYGRLRDLARPILRGGFHAIVDAAFLRREQRDAMRTLAVELQVPFIIVHVQASEDVLRQRVSARAATGADASEATIEVLEHQLRTVHALSSEEQAAALVLNTERPDLRAQVAHACETIASRAAAYRPSMD